MRADITTFGKALGAGFPVAAITGRAEIMDTLRWGGVLHYGTQNANPTLLAVVRESLDLLAADHGAMYGHLERLAARLVTGLRAAIADGDMPALVQNVGPMLQIFFLLPGHEAVLEIADFRDFGAHADRERFNRFAHRMFEHGVYLSTSAALHSVLATVHTEEDVDHIVAAARQSLTGLA